jgi:hypothetical protein
MIGSVFILAVIPCSSTLKLGSGRVSSLGRISCPGLDLQVLALSPSKTQCQHTSTLVVLTHIPLLLSTRTALILKSTHASRLCFCNLMNRVSLHMLPVACLLSLPSMPELQLGAKSVLAAQLLILTQSSDTDGTPLHAEFEGVRYYTTLNHQNVGKSNLFFEVGLKVSLG